MRDGAFLAFCSGSKRIAHGLRRAWPIDEHGNFPAYSRGAQTRGAQTRVRRARPAKRPCLSGAILGPGVCAPQPRAPSEVWPGQAARGRGCHAIGATPVLRRQLPWQWPHQAATVAASAFAINRTRKRRTDLPVERSHPPSLCVEASGIGTPAIGREKSPAQASKGP